jgi:hypothetical protein
MSKVPLHSADVVSGHATASRARVCLSSFQVFNLRLKVWGLGLRAWGLKFGVQA